MESKRAISTLGFQTLQVRLIAEINSRVDNGIFTERALARMAGISQPHLHNILKGARKLSPEMADLLLAQTGLSVVSLLTAEELLGSVPRKPAASAEVLNTDSSVRGRAS